MKEDKIYPHSINVTLKPDNRELWEKLGFKTYEDYIKSFTVIVVDKNGNYTITK